MKLLILLVECVGFAPYASHAFILYPFSGCCDLGFLLHSFISCALCLEIVAFVFKQEHDEAYSDLSIYTYGKFYFEQSICSVALQKPSYY